MISLFKKKTESDAKPKKQGSFSLSSPDKSLTLISIDEGWLKIVHAKGHFKKRCVEFVWAESILNLSDEEIVARLQELLRHEKLNGSHFLISHPSHLTRARTLRLPSTVPAELSVMVDLQVEKHTPDAKEETLTYFRVIDSDPQGYSNVFLVMANQDVVYRTVRMVQKLPGQLKEVGSDVEGLIHWYRRISQKEKEKPVGGTLLVDLDSDYASLLVFHGEEACFHRSIPLKTEAVLNDASGDSLGHFLAEVHRSLMAYEEEDVKGLCSRVILTGEAVKLSGFTDKISAEMKLPVTFVPMESEVNLSDISKEYLSASGKVSFAGMFGFISGVVLGDLTPADVKVRRNFQKKVKLVSVLGAQVLFVLLLLSGFLLKQAHDDQQYEDFLKTKTEQMEKPAGELEVTLEHLKIIKDRLEKKGIMLEALVAIKAATPPEVQWNDFTYTPEGLTIKGISREMTKVFEMITVLEKSPLFLKPEARKVAKRKVDKKDVTDFEISAPFAEGE